ncbi:hypothetical protein B0T20DRAFT_357069 [Sordaria brevicollis]|uniref:Uncharacterized protein n=1 Tax=Sordaria brevicollis TaxID=83679 RepID=A0AAE0PBX1_SORBR|nr:hypothetical protein B0T20DRAFT_357069 [Sordaria brevicollis]
MLPDEVDHAEVVSKLFQDIIVHTSYEKLKGICDENAELRDKVKKLTTTHETNLQSLHNTQARLDKAYRELQEKDKQVQSLQKEADHSGAIIAAKTHQLDEKAQKITRAENDLENAKSKIADLTQSLEEERRKSRDKEAIEQELEAARQERDDYRLQLEEVKNFSIPLGRESAEEIANRFNKIFAHACDLAKKFFGVNLPQSSFANATLWDQLRKHNIVHQARIPLPLSNTTAAKQMRTAAVLAVLYAELREHVFHPTYLFEDARANEELTRLLKTMDPVKEAYLRSVLLGSIDKAVWKEKVKAKIETLTANVDNCVGPLLPESERARFRDRLDRFCRKACQVWHHMQKLVDRVYYSTEDWAPPNTAAYHALQLSSLVVVSEELLDETFPGEYPESPRQNYSLMGNGQSSPVMSCSNLTFAHDIDKLSTPPSPPGSIIRALPIASTAATADASTAHGSCDLLNVVWPAFHLDPCASEEDMRIIAPGYGVYESQLKTAREEEAHSTGTQRAIRQNRKCRNYMGVSRHGADHANDDHQQDGEYRHGGCESTLSSFLNAGQSEVSMGSRRGW